MDEEIAAGVAPALSRKLDGSLCSPLLLPRTLVGAGNDVNGAGGAVVEWATKSMLDPQLAAFVARSAEDAAALFK